jgi:hypoxanthine phosphoribosyltransferase
MRTNDLCESNRPRREKVVANSEIRREIGARVDWAEARRRWPRASAGTGSVVCGPEPVVVDPRTWITTVRLVEDTARLCSQLPGDLDAVLGIARSGLLPATQVAVMLHRRLFSVRTFETDPAQILDCGGGWRLLGTGDRGQGTGDREQSLKKIVIVDDTAWHGIAIQHVKRLAGQRWPGAELFTAVVYAHPQTLSLLDYGRRKGVGSRICLIPGTPDMIRDKDVTDAWCWCRELQASCVLVGSASKSAAGLGRESCGQETETATSLISPASKAILSTCRGRRKGVGTTQRGRTTDSGDALDNS